MFKILDHWRRLTDIPDKNDPEAPINWKEYKARIKNGDGIDHTLSTTSGAIEAVRKKAGGRSGPRSAY